MTETKKTSAERARYDLDVPQFRRCALDDTETRVFWACIFTDIGK